MDNKQNYDDANAGKADFEWAYNRLDPRSYFQALSPLDYTIPERAAPVFRRVFDAYSTMRRKDDLTALDIGCSYGINAAVLKYGCKMDELRDRYGNLDEADAAPQDVLRADQTLFASRKPRQDIHVIGIDRAQCAASYAFWAGLLDDAIPENFEEHDPSPHAASALAKCDFVISTGVVGYVTERTFERIIACQPDDGMPWVASFVLRMFDYDPVARALETSGYGTEKLTGRYFFQRRFRDEEEQGHVEHLLHEKGLDTDGLESEGHYLAEFYLSRPKDDIARAPLSQIVPRSPQIT
jgi:hypothetical protein